jgi:hypothetical protein
MALDPGTVIGRYRVTSLIGHGGMGDVYRAVDTTLERAVALKVLEGDRALDDERIQRFVLEARAASALNHPNIVAIHEAGASGPVRFIAAELVEGRTLRDLISAGPLPIRDALTIAAQIASALAAAHAAGIVHRDIKPENVIVRPDGYVKVLDFGLAKLTEAAGALGDAAGGVTVLKTTAGMIMGTVAYMSPEQARGLPVDARSDCFSLGVVLFEMVAGRAPFGGATPSDTLVAILEKDAPTAELRMRGLPWTVSWILAKALDKDTELRYQTAADFRVDLDRIRRDLASGDLSESRIQATDTVSRLTPDLTDDDPRVVALSRFTRPSAALIALAGIALFLLGPLYRLTPAAELRSFLPRAAIETRAFDVAGALGYDVSQHRADPSLREGPLDLPAIAARSGLDDVRRAVREGLGTEWRVRLHRPEPESTPAPDPSDDLSGDRPPPGDFVVTLSPTGRLVGFAAGRQAGATPGPLTRDAAIAKAASAAKQHLNVDVTTLPAEYVARTYPVPITEISWRNDAPVFGHRDAVRAELDGDRLLTLSRVYRPIDRAPTAGVVSEGIRNVIGALGMAAVVAVYLLGITALVRSRRWDLLHDRVSLGAALSIAAGIATNATFTGIDGFMAAAVLLIFSVLLAAGSLPAFAGLFYWLRSVNPSRLVGIDRLAHGRIRSLPAASAIVHGAAAGVLLSALFLASDAAAMLMRGYRPSLDAAKDIVEASTFANSGPWLAVAIAVALGIALLIEFPRKILNTAIVGPVVCALVVSVSLSELHRYGMPAALVRLGGFFAVTASLMLLYWRRGFAAVWIAALVVAALLELTAARNIGSPDTAGHALRVGMILTAIAALGAWGILGTRITAGMKTLGSRSGLD